jgi:hypothetical protein
MGWQAGSQILSVSHFTMMLSTPLYFLDFFNVWWGCCLPPLLGVSLNSLDLWELVSDNEKKFLPVAACILLQQHITTSLTTKGQWGCLGCLFEYWSFDYVGMEQRAGHINSKEFVLHVLHTPPALQIVKSCASWHLQNFIVGCLMGYAKYSLTSTVWVLVQYLGQFNVGFDKCGAKY